MHPLIIGKIHFLTIPSNLITEQVSVSTVNCFCVFSVLSEQVLLVQKPAKHNQITQSLHMIQKEKEKNLKLRQLQKERKEKKKEARAAVA